jgi:hypothetical protein
MVIAIQQFSFKPFYRLLAGSGMIREKVGEGTKRDWLQTLAHTKSGGSHIRPYP